MFHLSLRAAHLVLELPAGVLEGIVKGECQIGMPFVRWWRPFYIHLATVRKGQTNVNFVKSAFAVMLTGPFQHDPTCCYATPTLFELRHVGRNGVFDIRCSRHALKFDFGGCLHFPTPACRLDAAKSVLVA
jgi:hypothetical protein